MKRWIGGHKVPHPDSVWDLVGPFLPQREETPIQSIADALGITAYLADNLLGCHPTIEVLLGLHRLAQYQELALARQLWPQCPWYGVFLPWEELSLCPEVVIVLSAFGAPLLDHVSDIDEDTAVDYVHRFQLPSEYQIPEPGAALSPAQIVQNPYAPDETFTFGDPATARCFEWLIADPQHYAHYLDSQSDIIGDPLGIQEAYLLRSNLIKHYIAPLPPDTLPNYLALADALVRASVPEVIKEGSVEPVSIVRAGQISAPSLQLVQENGGNWRAGPILAFDHHPVNVFVLADLKHREGPAAVILTTAEEAGDPEKYRQSRARFDLPGSEAAAALAFLPALSPGAPIDVAGLKPLRYECERVWGGCVQDETNQTWCFYLSFLQEVVEDSPELSKPVTVYPANSAYLVQFDPSYTFAPDEMAVVED